MIAVVDKHDPINMEVLTSAFQIAISIVQSTAYSDQMAQGRFVGNKSLTKSEYDKIINRSRKIFCPPDLGYRILNFLYF